MVNDPRPPSSAKTGIKREFLGLPLWSWGLGVGALVIGLVFYMRQRSAAASSAAGSPQIPTPSGASSPTVYPFFMGSNTSTATPADTPTSSQNFGTIMGKGFAGNEVPNTVPLYAIPGADPNKPLSQQSVSWAPDKTVFTVTGPPAVGNWGGQAAGFFPVIYQGQNYYVSAADMYPQNTVSAAASNMPAAIA